jgi:hypothetical protein
VEGDVDGLAGAEEAGAEGDFDLEVGELRPELARLSPASPRERGRMGRVAADHVRDVGDGLGMPG